MSPRTAPDRPALESPEVRVLVGCWEVWQALAGAGDEALRTAHGLNLREFIALSHVQGSGDGVCSPAELAAALGVPRYEVSRTLGRLEALGAVRRTRTGGTDARQVRVELTPHGAQLWEAALGTVQALVRPVLAPLGDALPGLGNALHAAARLARQLTPGSTPPPNPLTQGHPP